MKTDTNVNEQKKTSNVEVSGPVAFRDFWHLFTKLRWTLAASAVAFAVAAFAYFSITFVPMYKSTVRFTITPLVQSSSHSGASVYNFNYNTLLATQMAETFPYIMNSGILTDIISNDMGGRVNGIIESKAITDTNIFEVSVSSTSAENSYKMVNLLIENYPKVAEYVVGDTRMQVIEGSEPTLATKPYNTAEKYKYVFLAAVLGAGFATLYIYIRARLNKTVKNRRDIERKLNGKCICEIPIVERKRTGKNKPMLKVNPNSSAFSESVRVLKQRVHSAMAADGSKVLGITSAVSNEGKTTIAYNLAKALSSGTARVLLIDMDLRNRSLQSYLNRKNQVSNTGITDVAVKNESVENVINSVSDTFDIMFAGCQNNKFKKSDYTEIFDYLRSQYDYIVVDLPTCGIASEAATIADLCDKTLFVVKWNSTSHEKIKNATAYMSYSKAKMLGYILNEVETEYSDYGGYRYNGVYGKRRYGYGYGYGYAGAGYGAGASSEDEGKEKS